MKGDIIIRNYRPDDLPALVALINEADAVDRLERATTLQRLEHELSFPTIHPETDFYLSWEGDRLVGYTELYVRQGDASTASTIYCRGVVHPQWRRRGLGRRLLEAAYGRATDYLADITEGQVNFQCSTHKVEEDRKALFEGFGMKPVRYFVNSVRPLNGSLPPVRLPAGIRLRTFDPERDLKAVWQVDDAAFRDHWGYTESKLEEFEHWIQMPHFRPELCFLAEEKTSGKTVGLGLNLIEPGWIAHTGRQEGYVDTLAVLQEHRRKGLGTALLVKSLHALQEAGMEAAHLHADSENLTGAMRLYERVGFRVRKTLIAYQKVMRDRKGSIATTLGDAAR
jgi:mycothiol synthase